MISLLLNVHPCLTATYYLQQFFFKTQSRLSSINFEKEDIFKIIRNLNIDEAHGHGNISMQMFTTCDSVLPCHLYIKIV